MLFFLSDFKGKKRGVCPFQDAQLCFFVYIYVRHGLLLSCLGLHMLRYIQLVEVCIDNFSQGFSAQRISPPDCCDVSET